MSPTAARTGSSCWSPPSKKRSDNACSRSARARDVQRRVELVEDVVGVAREAVQRVYRRALVRGEQSGGKEVGAAVFGGDLSAAPIGRAQPHILDAGGVQLGADHRDRAFRSRVVVLGATLPVIRSAANRPEINVVGTPTPGSVDEPASTALSMPRTVLAGRNGPV